MLSWYTIKIIALVRRRGNCMKRFPRKAFISLTFRYFSLFIMCKIIISFKQRLIDVKCVNGYPSEILFFYKYTTSCWALHICWDFDVDGSSLYAYLEAYFDLRLRSRVQIQPLSDLHEPASNIIIFDISKNNFNNIYTL